MLVKPDNTSSTAVIKVIGIGGGGCNAIDTMISDYNIEGVEFIAVNTDAQALKRCLASVHIQIGPELTKGLGAGGDPDMGFKAAEESAQVLHDALAGSDMVFITTGMGGGTGTGAAPVIGGIARNIGALTVAVVTRPFKFEMKKRMDYAIEGISRLKDNVDTMIVVPNQRIIDITDKHLSFVDAMKKVDAVLANAVQSISGLVTQIGLINLDFADVRAVLKDQGTAMMGIGKASGENRAEQAAKQAITSPLLEMSIEGSKGVLFYIQGSSTMTLNEVQIAADLITSTIDSQNSIVKFGATIQENLNDEMQITVLAAGFDPNNVSVKNQSLNQNNSLNPNVNKFGQDNPNFNNNINNNLNNGMKSNNKSSPFEDELEIPAFLRRN